MLLMSAGLPAMHDAVDQSLYNQTRCDRQRHDAKKPEQSVTPQLVCEGAKALNLTGEENWQPLDWDNDWCIHYLQKRTNRFTKRWLVNGNALGGGNASKPLQQQVAHLAIRQPRNKAAYASGISGSGRTTSFSTVSDDVIGRVWAAPKRRESKQGKEHKQQG